LSLENFKVNLYTFKPRDTEMKPDSGIDPSKALVIVELIVELSQCMDKNDHYYNFKTWLESQSETRFRS
jgi:hypothetical protein